MTSSKKNSLEHILINTSTVEPKDIYDAWRMSFTPLLDAIPRHQFSPKQEIFVEAFSIDACVIMHHQFNAQIFRRDKKRIAYYDNDCVAVCLWLDGNNVLDNAGKYTQVKKGSVFMIDMGKTVESIASASNAINMIIPKPMLRKFGVDTNKLLGRHIPSGDPRFDILCSTFLTTFNQLPNISTEHAPAISKGLVSLVASLMCDIQPSSEAALTLRQSTLASIVNYIETNISDHRLGVKSLLRKFPISRSTLYNIFEPLGGVAQYIRDQRLHQCYKTLVNTAYLDVSISKIAKSWGFSNTSYFCSLFRSHYKITPTEARDIASSKFNKVPGIKTALIRDAQIERINNWLVHSSTYLDK